MAAADESPEPTFAELLSWSLDAEPELLPYLPELFADIEELGVRVTDVMSLLDQVELPSAPRFLDLGFGKGAVALRLLEAFPEASVHGIDGLEAFVAHAELRAKQAGHEERSVFAQGDLRRAVLESRDYDVVCFLAMGVMLGPLEEAVAVLRDCVRPGGYLLLDDAFVRDDEPRRDDSFVCDDRSTTLAKLTSCGDTIVGECIVDGPETLADYEAMTARVAARAKALAVAHPQDAEMILEYVTRHQEEAEVLAGPLVGALWLLRRGPDQVGGDASARPS